MASTTEIGSFGWLSIIRLGLVQAALGSIVVLTTSTMNRVMAVELALPVTVPGFLVAIHYAVQMSRPRWGYGSDVGGRRTPWIIGGMAVLALGGVLAALAIWLMSASGPAGLTLAVIAFVLIGVGVGAAGTSLLALLAKQTNPMLRPAAATTVWVMMIIGFILTTAIAGHYLDPYSPGRLVVITAIVAALAFSISVLAVWGVEPTGQIARTPDATSVGKKLTFAESLAEISTEPRTRQFAIFVFVSMLAYSAQELIIEPFAGSVFGMTPGQSTKLASVQHMGVLAGMILVACVASLAARFQHPAVKSLGSLGAWSIIGCLASAVSLVALSVSGSLSAHWPLQATVFVLGLSNGIFAVSAIGSMMALAGADVSGREGIQMGLWGAAQAIAFGLGGFAGTLGADVMRRLTGSAQAGYGSVFAAEAALFVISAGLAAQVWRSNVPGRVSTAGSSPFPQRNPESQGA